MTIRLARNGDLEAINRIYNQAVVRRFCTAHLQPVDMQYREQWFTRHHPEKYPVFVSERDGAITGWMSISPYREGRQALSHVGELSYYVDRDFQRQGVGSSLLGHAIAEAPRLGISVLIAILLDRNPASIKLLEKFGFTRWGSMPGIAVIGGETADHLYYGLKL
jgi:L-amino acid N-acyltransferase YncA